jgi:glutamate--cysteine ligase
VSPIEFSRLLNIDPWLIDPYFDQCGGINFQARLGEDCLAEKVAGC